MIRACVMATVVSVGFFVLVVRAVRRRRLGEQAALLWLCVSAAMVVLSATLPLHVLDRLSNLVGIAYPPDLLLLLAVLFLVALLFHQTLSLAKLQARHTTLVQELGILTAVAAHPPADVAAVPAPAEGQP